MSLSRRDCSRRRVHSPREAGAREQGAPPPKGAGSERRLRRRARGVEGRERAVPHPFRKGRHRPARGSPQHGQRSRFRRRKGCLASGLFRRVAATGPSAVDLSCAAAAGHAIELPSRAPGPTRGPPGADGGGREVLPHPGGRQSLARPRRRRPGGPGGRPPRGPSCACPSRSARQSAGHNCAFRRPSRVADRTAGRAPEQPTMSDGVQLFAKPPVKRRRRSEAADEGTFFVYFQCVSSRL